MESASSILSGSRFSNIESVGSRNVLGASGVVPPSAWEQPAQVQFSMQVADGEVGAMDTSREDVGKLLHDLEATSVNATGTVSGSVGDSSQSRFGTLPCTATFGDSHLSLRRKPTSPSMTSLESATTVTPDALELPRKTSMYATSESGRSPPLPSRSSFGDTLTNGLTHAMRFMLNNQESKVPVSPNKDRGLVSADIVHIVGRFGSDSSSVVRCETIRFVKAEVRGRGCVFEEGRVKVIFGRLGMRDLLLRCWLIAWNVADP
jgi:hypothetical protein